MDLTNVKILDETKTTENTNTDVYRWGEKSLLHEAYEGNLEMVKSLVTNGINVLIFCFNVSSASNYIISMKTFNCRSMQKMQNISLHYIWRH